MNHNKIIQIIAFIVITFFYTSQRGFAKSYYNNEIASDGEYKLKQNTKKRYLNPTTNEVTVCFECERSAITKFIGGKSLFSGGHIIVSPTMYSSSAGNITVKEMNQGTQSPESTETVQGQKKSQPGFSVKVGNEKVFDYNLYLGQDLFFEYIEAKTSTQINHPTNGLLNLKYENHTAFGYMTKVGFLLGQKTILYGIFGFSLFNNSNFKALDSSGKQLEMYEKGGGDGFAPKLGMGLNVSLSRHLQVVLEAYTFASKSMEYESSWYQKATSTNTNGSNNYNNLYTVFSTSPTLTAVSLGLAYKF